MVLFIARGLHPPSEVRVKLLLLCQLGITDSHNVLVPNHLVLDYTIAIVEQ